MKIRRFFLGLVFLAIAIFTFINAVPKISDLGSIYFQENLNQQIDENGEVWTINEIVLDEAVSKKIASLVLKINLEIAEAYFDEKQSQMIPQFNLRFNAEYSNKEIPFEKICSQHKPCQKPEKKVPGLIYVAPQSDNESYVMVNVLGLLNLEKIKKFKVYIQPDTSFLSKVKSVELYFMDVSRELNFEKEAIKRFFKKTGSFILGFAGVLLILFSFSHKRDEGSF